ncbi:MAG: histidine kinase N-terminal 7TM domain-containing protein [Bacillota bacterium]|nr:histidine kinase N-terminal 7TM domain-containing protein [Bacillota bacterium]
MTWYYAYNQDLWPAMISVVLSIILGIYSWNRRNVPGAKAFAIGCFFAMLWAIGSSLEIAAVDFSTKVFWLKFHALWQIPVVTALSCFFLAYAGFGRFLTRRNLILLSIPALLIFTLMVTNKYHHLIWASFSFDKFVIAEYGVGTWISILYANLLGIVNFLALLSLAIRSPRSRWPVALMMLGQISGRIMYVLDSLYNQVLSPGESVLIVIGLSCSVYAYALFHFRVLDPIPLARSIVIEQMSDGMLVLDMHGHIVDINPAATVIFDKPASGLCGRSVVEMFPADSGIEVQPDKIELTKSEISLGLGPNTHYYSIGLTHLLDKQGEALGSLLLLHDTTGQKHSQKLLIEQQRVVATLQEREHLARELHDSIGQVLGYISMQAQAAQKWVMAGNNEKTAPILSRLAEVAQEAHADVRESILSLRIGMAPQWSFLQALRKYLDHYQTSFNIDTELELPEQMSEDILNPDVGVQVMRVIQEAMTNASRHGGAHNVKVVFAQENDHVNISITDNGSGFNPAKLNQEAGNHFGLMFMRERMAQIGGSVIIKSQLGSGTTVILNVPFGT